MNKIKKFLSTDGTIRIASVISTDLAREATAFQSLSPLAATLVGRAITGAALMASHMKSRQKIGLHFQGNGPIQHIFAEATYEGAARAYCDNKSAELPTGETRIGEGLGTGRLDVVYSIPFQKEPHRGTVELMSGEIGDDIAFYLNQSQQIPAIVALTAIPDEASYELCGGFIVELMPGVTELTLLKLESIQKDMTHVSRMIRGGASAEDLVHPILKAFDFSELEYPYELHHQCVCSIERMERTVKLLGAESLAEMLDLGEEPEVTCEFCGARYQLSREQVRRLLAELSVGYH